MFTVYFVEIFMLVSALFIAACSSVYLSFDISVNKAEETENNAFALALILFVLLISTILLQAVWNILFTVIPPCS